MSSYWLRFKLALVPKGSIFHSRKIMIGSGKAMGVTRGQMTTPF